MGKHCCEVNTDKNVSAKFKKILYIALIINFSMFILEVYQSYQSQSLSLKADAIDFFGDSVNYAVSIFFLGYLLKTRAKVSILKAMTMVGFGLWILYDGFLAFSSAFVPKALTMGWVGAIALIANALVAFSLYKFREGDSNMQSVWLCSRNDALGNLFVIFASIGVFYFNSNIPDLTVSLIMSFLAIQAGAIVFKKAYLELKI